MTTYTGTQPNARTDWAAIGWAFLFFWYFSGVYHLLLQLFDATIFVGFRQALVVSSLWLVPLLLFPRYTRQLSAGIGLVLWACSLSSLGYFMIYQQEFSQSVIFIMFESNPAESSEYLAQYFKLWMALAYVAYSVGGWWLWTRVRPCAASKTSVLAISVLILSVLFVYPIARMITKSNTPVSINDVIEMLEVRMEPATPWQLVFGYTQYRKQLDAMQALLEQNKKLPPLGNLVDRNAKQPATVVLVIGESTNRQHMSLYGYPRETSPGLSTIKDVEVFKNVIGPRPYTIETLQQTLTFADQEHPDRYLTEPSLMNMMKQAGYKSFWVTNQQTMTKRNTMLTNFSQQMDEQVYLNHTRAQNSREYDTNVLEPFAAILKDPAERKFIVIHLLGAHAKYDYRYPESFEFFKGREGLAKWVTDEQLPYINAYDNAIRFNDYVMTQLINQFKASNPHGFLVYLSDHGEDLFESPGHKMLGRSEAAPTAAMYSVPFLVWRSDSWKRDNPAELKDFYARPYSLADFIHTWSDLAGIHHDKFDASRSLINSAFVERPLLVGDPYQTHKRKLIDLRPQLLAPTPAQ